MYKFTALAAVGFVPIIMQGCDEYTGGKSDDDGFSADGYEGDDSDECVDRVDNDRNGLFDCDDPGCAGSPDCTATGEGEGEG
ncbi:MAG TPA: hypothetical protein DFR83_23285, partial [Deltaproteobacteria bacterium]|nr:hypothetical protein [Deltaproteobacteria bacterium]